MVKKKVTKEDLRRNLAWATRTLYGYGITSDARHAELSEMVGEDPKAARRYDGYKDGIGRSRSSD
jgi:hypothetical protein